MAQLGVNIDHVATVRQARKTIEPDPAWAAVLAELGGADGITLHLREDRRHIQNRDLYVLKETTHVKLNLECACSQEMIEIACKVKPDQVTLVPEKRQELTTEGGLDVIKNRAQIWDAVKILHHAKIEVSLFLDPDLNQIVSGSELGVQAVELHTGKYANAKTKKQQKIELETLTNASKTVLQRGMILHAGHGLTYQNVKPIAAIAGMSELNIGHSIVARSIMVGFQQAVREMKDLIE